MDSVAILDEQSLRAQLAQARERLDGLVRKLRAVDREMDDLSTERQQHRLLQDVCGALEQLGELGGARLFWGERAVAGEIADQIRAARGRVDAFQKRLSEIEERREAILEEIEQEQEGAAFLEYDVIDAQEQAERRRQEWIIEREVAVFPVHQLVMPWMRGGEEDRRFRKALGTSLLLALLVGVLLPLVDLPLPELPQPIEAPERVTRLIPERRRTPPPVQQETRPQERKPEPVEKPLAAEAAKPTRGPEQAPEAPGSKGILAFREQFSGLADNRRAAQLGRQARISRAGEVASGAPERSMVTSQAPGSSGGVNLAALSRGMGGRGGQQLDGIEVARATSSIAASGAGGGSGRAVAGGGPPVGRTDEEIQIVFDRHKAALYRLYNRELRSDPTLKGQMVLRLRIEPDGSVTLCELQGTDMNAPQLVAQVLERVRTFDFGAKEVPAITILYPIDFLPAT